MPTLMIAEQAEMLADWVKRTEATMREQAQEAIREFKRETGEMTELRHAGRSAPSRERRDQGDTGCRRELRRKGALTGPQNT